MVIGCTEDEENPVPIVTPTITQQPENTNAPLPTTTDDVVTFPDSNLESSIRWAIKKPKGEIKNSDLEGLIHLYVPSPYRNIVDLTGLEKCPNLTNLGLENNMIVDISPLVGNLGLDHGGWIDIRWNPLNETSINTYIPLLIGRGVHVDWEPPLEPELG